MNIQYLNLPPFPQKVDCMADMARLTADNMDLQDTLQNSTAALLGHYPDNTVHWPNADVMLDHRLLRWANIIPA